MPARTIKDGVGLPTVHSGHHMNTYADTEFVGDVFGTSVAYDQYVYRVNPQVARSFPTLSGLVSPYVEYRFEHLEYIYKPNVTSLTGSNTLLGYVGLVLINDPYEPAFTNKSQFLQTFGAVSVRADQSLRYVVDLAKVSGTRYKFLSPGSDYKVDERLQDLGLLTVCRGSNNTTNITGSTDNIIGQLYVKYKVMVRKIRPMVPLGNMNLFSHFICSGSFGTGTSLFGTIQTAQPGTNLNVAVYNNAITSTSSNLGTVIQFPDVCYGTFMLTIYVVGNNTSWNDTNVGISNTSLGNSFVSNVFFNNNYHNLETGNGTTMSFTIVFNIVAIGDRFSGPLAGTANQIEFDSSITIPGSATYSEFIIVQIPTQSIQSY